MTIFFNLEIKNFKLTRKNEFCMNLVQTNNKKKLQEFRWLKRFWSFLTFYLQKHKNEFLPIRIKYKYNKKNIVKECFSP